MQTQWQEGIHNEFAVRAIYPEALSGDGAIIGSNESRVYVIESNLPNAVIKGHLLLRSQRWCENCIV